MNKNNLKNADEAVSPVIGVILMVAITVVLAAVVFVLVSNLGGDSDSAPQMGFTTDQAGDSIRLTTADPGLTWDMFSIRTNATINFALNGDPAAGDPAPSPEDVGDSTNQVTGGDTISFCHDHALPATSAPVTIVHKDTNTEVYTTTFVDIAPC